MIRTLLYYLVLLMPNLTYKLVGLVSTHYTSLLVPFLTSKKLAFDVRNIYDIGSNKGLWSRSRRFFYPNASFFLFEPNVNHNRLSRKFGTVFNVVLSDVRKKVNFYQSDKTDGTGDSYYKENSLHYRNNFGIEMDAVPLIDLIRDNGLPIPDYIKIDTQGAELDIIKGAEEILNEVCMISLEINMYDYNEAAPNLVEIFSYLEEKGFYARSIIEQHINRTKFENGILNQIDVLFVNKIYL